MTIGGLYVIDGIDVVATLVTEEDVWQFEATETCTTETQMQDREQDSIAAVDNEDPSATEAIEAYDARTGEKLDSEEVRKGRTKEVRELHEFEVKMEVDESEMRSTPGEKIWSTWVETRKDPYSPAVRCRLCATEVNTPPKDLRKGKIWRLLKSLYGTRDASQVFATYVEEGLTDHGFQRNAVVPCLYWGAMLDALGVHWGNDFIFGRADDLEQLMREVFKDMWNSCTRKWHGTLKVSPGHTIRNTH